MTTKRVYHHRPLETADTLDDRRRADPGAALCAHTRRAASHADLAPPALRPGAQDFLACPSRTGGRLYHRDGRVTNLDGHPISPKAL